MAKGGGGGGSASSLAHNNAAKDDIISSSSVSVSDLLSNDAGGAHNFTLIGAGATLTDGVVTLDDGVTDFTYQVQIGNGTWSQATVHLADSGLTAPPPPTGQTGELLVNGDFEADPLAGLVTSLATVTGWTNTSGHNVELLAPGYSVIVGSGQMLDTQSSPGGITISQAVDVQTGATADLTIKIAEQQTPGGVTPGSALTISFDGQTVLTLHESDFSDVGPNALKAFHITVTGQAGMDTLQIHDDGTGSVGYAIDSVSLTGLV